MIRDMWTRLPQVLRVWAPGLMVVAVGLVGFIAILDQVHQAGAFESFDEPLLDWFVSSRSTALTTAMTVVTHLFGSRLLPVLVAVGAAAWGIRTRAWRDPVLLVGAMAVSTIITVAVKLRVARARPAETLQVVPGLELSFSFPSGHTTGAATLVLVTAYLLWRGRRSRRALLAWSVGALLTLALVGGSRLYLGYHFLSDVLAGVCVGLFALGLVICEDRWLTAKPGAAPAVRPA